MAGDGDGVTIKLLPSGAWQYRLRDGAGNRKAKSFLRQSPDDDNRRKQGTADGDAWAKKQRARYALGQASAAKVHIRDVLDDFIEVRRDLGRTEKHLAMMVRAVALVEAAKVGDLSDPRVARKTHEAIAKHRACRHNQKNPIPANARTKNSYIAALRALGNFAVQEQMLPFNPFMCMRGFREIKKPKATYPIDEIRAFVADDHLKDPWFRFIALAVYTGARSETIRRITWGMVDRQARRIKIPGTIMKCSNDIRIPIQTELGDLLDAWGKGFPSARIVNVEGIEKMSSDRANELTQAFIKRCGITPNGRSSHAFRHSCAGLLTATGMKPFGVMDYLGHSNTATSKHYSTLADLYTEQIKAERWPEGEFFLRRPPPSAMVAINA